MDTNCVVEVNVGVWSRMWRSARELGLMAAVAGVVTLGGTLVGSVFDRVHQVDAESLRGSEVKAVAAGEQQVLTITDWNVRLTLPLNAGLSAVSYAAESPMSVGLSTADLAALGSDCRAGRDGLGSLLRLPAGSYPAYVGRDVTLHYVGRIGEHDYAYKTPHNECGKAPGAPAVINREMVMLSGTWGTLEAVGSGATEALEPAAN